MPKRVYPLHLRQQPNLFMFFQPNVLFQLVFRRPYGIHSPFLFDLANACIFANKPEAAFRIIENKRKELLRDNTILQITDFGQGPRKGNPPAVASPATYKRSVRSIARNSLQTPGYCRLLWRLIQHFKPQNILELGTSLGLTTSYMALAMPHGRVFSIEGCPQTAAKAKELWEIMGISNISLQSGSFGNTLPGVLSQIQKVDFVYIDGGHSYSGVMDVFAKISPYLHRHSVLVIDDIRWSAEMTKAWLEITANPTTTMSLDLYRMGISFCNPGLSKQIIPVGY